MYRSSEIIKEQDPLSESQSLFIIMVWLSYHCPGQIEISAPGQYAMSWSENYFETRV